LTHEAIDEHKDKHVEEQEEQLWLTIPMKIKFYKLSI
jgi:hypothetical protein